MSPQQAWDLAFDPATGRRIRQEEVAAGTILPDSRWPNFFSRLVARLQWDANGIDLGPDVEAWPGVPDDRRERLTTLLAAFRIADDAVSVHLEPFGPAAKNSLVAWVMYLQRRDEQRHATFFDRVAAEVLKLPGDTKEERHAAARELCPPGILELFEERLPAMAAEMEAGRADLSDGMALYHMTLEGMVLSAGQRALLEESEAAGLPGIHDGVRRVELDERWHIGFGLRCLIETRPSSDLLDDVLARAEDAAAAWGEAIPPATQERAVRMCARRLHVAAHEAERQVVVARHWPAWRVDGVPGPT